MNVYTPTNVIVHEVDVHFESRIISKPIHVVQYDDRLPVVKVNLYTGNNGDEQYELPEGADVNIRYCRPDGHVVYNPVLGKDSTSNNVVYFEITQAMLIKNGKGRGVLEVTLNGKLACSSEIIFEIDRNPIQEESIEATDEFKSVVQYAAEAESAASSIRDLTVEAITGEPGTDATVEKSGGTGPEDPYHLKFIIPKGESGSAGNISVVAEEYSASKTYKEGQFVMHNNDLYVAKLDISTAEAWNANHWIRLNISDALYNQQVEIDHKADIDGSYEDLTAGSAEQLLSSVSVKDTTPYSFRPSGGNLEIGNREEQRKIVGATVVQNQLINPNSSQSSGTTDGVTVTNNKDGSYILTGTKTSNANTYYYLMYSLPVGSKYVICGANTANAGGGGASGGYNLFCAYLGANASFAKQQGSQPLIINPSDTTKDGWRLQLQIGYANGAINTYNDTIRPMVINITQRFGAEFADWLYTLPRAKYTEILYQLIPELNGGFIPFDTGVLGSVNVSKHKMTQYNQWDEEWEVGKISTTTGLPMTSTENIRSKNFIRVLPNTVYFWCANVNNVICYYDVNKNYISTEYCASNITFQTPYNCRYVKFYVASSYGTVYKNDICISFYYDGERAGEYEPFKLHEYDYDSSVELRGMLKVDENGNIYADGDEYKADGSVKRKWGIANLGTAITSWDYQQRGGYGRFGAIQKLAGASTSGGTDINILCGKYAPNASLVSANAVNKAICLYNGSVYIRDDNYTTSAQLVTALQNVWIIYPLATIAEETANPYTETQVVDNWGTEEFVDAQGRSIVLPVGHVTDYPQDLKAKLETAPNAPSENGDYIVRQSSNGTEYVPYTDGTRIDNLEETKSDKNGHYEEMTVGNAEQLLSNNYLEDNTAYNFRRTAGGKAVGDREIDEIIGGTLVINQFVKNGNFEDTSAWLKSNSVLQVQNNIGTLIKNASTPYGTGYISQYIPLIASHKYLFRCEYKAGEGVSLISLFYSGRISVSDTNWHTYYRFVNPVSDVPSYEIIFWIVQDTSESTLSLQLRNIVAIDITQLFGSSSIADYVYNKEQTTALSGINWLYEYFPILNGGYIPYNAGTLQSIVLSKHKLTGFNQWDEEWETGAFNTITGLNTTGRTQIRSKNLIRVIPNMSYFFTVKNNSSNILWILPYGIDKKPLNKQYLTDVETRRNGNSSGILNNTIITIPSNCYYIKFYTVTTYGSSYKNDITFNFSGIRNGEYEPYNDHEYTLDSSKELRGVPKIDSNGKLYFDGDRYKDGVTRRYIFVDLGSLIWIARGNGIFSLGSSDRTIVTNSQIVCIDYAFELPLNVSKMSNKAITTFNYYNSKDLVIKDSTYANATATEFRTAMSGKMALILLETPTAEDATPIPNPQICSPDGTEEYIDPRVEAGTIPFAIPTGHNTKYLQNLRQKLDDLPFAPSEYGDYLVRVSADGIAFIPFANGTQIPTIPTSADGRYDLVADVSSGTVTLSWVLRS